MRIDELNWYTFSSKLHLFLIDKGYKMEYSNNCQQFSLDDIPHFMIDYENQIIHFNKDLYSRWYSMGFDKNADKGQY